MSAFKRYLDNDMGFKIYTHYLFMLMQVIAAALFFHLHESTASIIFFGTIILVMLVSTKDMSPLFLPLMLMIMSLLANYGASPLDFKSLIPLIVLLVLAVLIRPFVYRVRWTKGQMFRTMILVSISLTLGGVGYLTARQYFNIVPLYYVFGLGFGLVLMYLMVLNYTLNDSAHNPSKTLTKSMLFIGLFGILMIAPIGIDNIFGDTIDYVQWSNNLSTMLILTMPFAFYLAAKISKYGVFFFAFGLLQYLATLLTLSRGGILFGTVTVFLCIVATFICTDKINRIIYGAAMLAIFAVALIMIFTIPKIEFMFKDLLKVSPDEARVRLFETAIKNFLAHPLFGTGLAFKGEYYHPQKWAIYWYHSTPFQIIGSLGLLGILAYTVQLIMRAKICINRPSKFNIFATISLVGFELMAFVNPGDFTPLPSMMAFVVILAVIEINNRNRVAPKDMIFNNYKGTNWLELSNEMIKRKYKEPPNVKEK